MSQEAVHSFISKLERDAGLGAIVIQAFASNSDLDLVDLAGKHGFAFTREEGIKVWDELQLKGELSDALLEAVAGGAPTDCGDRKTKT